MSEILNSTGGVSPDPIVKAVLDTVGKVYIVEQGQTEDSDSGSSPIYWRVWSNGFIEQCQMTQLNRTTVVFPKPFKDTNYVLMGPGNEIKNVSWQGVTKSPTHFTVSYSSNQWTTGYWYACGY